MLELNKKHIDGVWNTEEHQYKDRKIIIKSRKGSGIKFHVFFPHSDKVDFTQRYNFFEVPKLLTRIHLLIDKRIRCLVCGTGHNNTCHKCN